MKSKYLIVALIFISFTISFCAEENKKEIASATNQGESIKENKNTVRGTAKCCASTIPARFSVRNTNIPQPPSGN